MKHESQVRTANCAAYNKQNAYESLTLFNVSSGQAKKGWLRAKSLTSKLGFSVKAERILLGPLKLKICDYAMEKNFLRRIKMPLDVNFKYVCPNLI